MSWSVLLYFIKVVYENTLMNCSKTNQHFCTWASTKMRVHVLVLPLNHDENASIGGLWTFPPRWPRCFITAIDGLTLLVKDASTPSTASWPLSLMDVTDMFLVPEDPCWIHDLLRQKPYFDDMSCNSLPILRHQTWRFFAVWWSRDPPTSQSLACFE